VILVKCLFVYNPESGKGKVKKKEEYIVSKLSSKYDIVDVIKTEYSGHAKVIAEENCGLYDTLVVAGGDGTLNEIVNALAEKQNAPIIGYIPTGTVNDVAHSLKIPCKIERAVDRILNGEVFCHDVFKCNDKYGLYVCAIGTITESSFATKQQSKKKFGKIAYFIHGAGKIFKGKAFNITVNHDGEKIEKNCSLFLAINSKHVAGFTVNKKAELSDGLIDVVMVDNKSEKRVGIASLLRIAKMFLFGLKPNKNTKHVTYLKLKEFDLTISPDTAINLDGEKGLSGSFHLTTIKQGIKIIR
jgi:YegS/Rv2252/BmrU family lipid kinase